MLLVEPGAPLVLGDIPIPEPKAGEVLTKVTACGFCRTDVHIADGELPAHRLPLLPGHEIVCTVAAAGAEVQGFAPGDRVGVPWLGGTCGACPYCLAGRENVCDAPEFTGYDRDGEYAEYCVARAAHLVRLPAGGSDDHVAPLLCAGLVGFRSYRHAGAVDRLGLIGFGAAAHIITQLACADGVEICAFTRPGDAAAQRLALELGANWAGGTDQFPPAALDAVIIFAPSGDLVPLGLRLCERAAA